MLIAHRLVEVSRRLLGIKIVLGVRERFEIRRSLSATAPGCLLNAPKVIIDPRLHLIRPLALRLLAPKLIQAALV